MYEEVSEKKNHQQQLSKALPQTKKKATKCLMPSDRNAPHIIIDYKTHKIKTKQPAVVFERFAIERNRFRSLNRGNGNRLV